MERMSDLMGTAERSYAKMLYPETSSGRMAQWGTLQSALDVLYCDGCIVRIQPMRGTGKHEALGVRTTEGTRRLIKAEAIRWDARMRREVLAGLSSMGGHARAASMTPGQRSRIASKAAKARWAKARAAA
jgi:hypothetical protein